MTEAEITRRLTTLHPTARRQLAAMTDTTYRGPHRIYRPSLSERFLSAVEHPAVATFAKVTFAGSVWFTGLAAAVVILLLIQGA